MNTRTITTLLRSQTHAAIVLFLYLWTVADSQGCAVASWEQLKESTGLARSTLSYALNELRNLGLVTIEQAGKRGTPTIYRLTGGNHVQG